MIKVLEFLLMKHRNDFRLLGAAALSIIRLAWIGLTDYVIRKTRSLPRNDHGDEF
jgi:hypothetical protein